MVGDNPQGPLFGITSCISIDWVGASKRFTVLGQIGSPQRKLSTVGSRAIGYHQYLRTLIW